MTPNPVTSNPVTSNTVTTPSPGVDAETRDALADLGRDLLARHVDLDHLRRHLDAGTAHDPDLWRRLADAGLLGALVPEADGGAGLTPAYLTEVLVESGRRALPEPFLETAVLGATLLAGIEDSDAARDWSRRLAAGDLVVGVRLADPVLGDLTPHVVHGADLDLLLDVTADGAVTAYPAAELEVTPLASLDPLRPLAALRPTGAGVPLGTDPALADRVRTLAVAGASCQLAGAVRALLEHTVDYVGVREQFGRPVGSFQAVKHAAADMAVMSDMAGAAARSALDAQDPRAAWAAKAYAGDAADLANVSALQLHGGIGFTWEYHLHVWLKRVMGLAASYGTTTTLRRALARDLLARRAGEVGRG